MTKKNTILKKLLLTFLLVLMCSSCFMLTACDDDAENAPTIYKLYQYENYTSTYKIGDNFCGMNLSANFVKLALNNDGTATLTISVGFLTGESELQNQYTTFAGSYTETQTEIIATFPEYNTSALRAIKTGNQLSIELSSYEALILAK